MALLALLSRLFDARGIGRLSTVGKCGMLLDAMLGDNREAFGLLILLGRRPGKVVATNLNIVIGELAVLVVIHTQELGLLSSPELKSRNHVNNLCKDGRHDKGVTRAGY